MAAMEKYTGAVPGYRRAHAHGHGFVGHFESTAAVAGLTVAEHLQGDRVDVVVRLSNGAGSPYAPDLQSARHGATLGLGIEFALPSGGRATWAAPNMAAFPAGTPQEFIAVTTAQRRNARGHRNPLRAAGLRGPPPRTVPGLMALVGHPPIRSFAAADFHGLHAYHLVDGEGRRQAFRYHWTSTMADERTVSRAGSGALAAAVPRRGDAPARGARAGPLGADLRAGPGRRSDRRSAARLAGVARRGSTPAR